MDDIPNMDNVSNESGIFFGKIFYTWDFIRSMKKLPLEMIFYCQNSIKNEFKDYGELEEGCDDIIIGNWDPEIEVCILDGRIYSLDNRRLHCCKVTEKKNVKVRFVSYIPNHKFTTDSKGESIEIRTQGY